MCIARPDAEVQRPVNLTDASGHPLLCPAKEYNDSILWGLLFKPHGRLKLILLAILHCHSNLVKLSQSPPTHLHHRFNIFVRLGENPRALLECLHLEALGVRVLLWISLVTLGGCRHLDGLEQRGSSSGGW